MTHPPHMPSGGSYVAGYVLSLILTATSFGLVALYKDSLSGDAFIILLVALGIVQLLVQLVFFLHMTAEQKPRWNLTWGVLAAIFIVIIAGGSLWIMANLEHNLGHDMFAEENITQETLSH